MSIRVCQFSNKKSYQASFRLDGKKIAKNFPRKSDAEHWIRSNLEKRQSGDLARLPQVTLNEFSKDWFVSYRLHVKPCTERNAEKLLRLWILPLLGHRRLDQIGPQDVKSLLARMIERGRSARTANYALAVLRKLLNDGINDWGYNFRNPAARMKPLQEELKKVSFWNKEEIGRFLDSVRHHNPSDVPLFRFLLNTGCRIGEACALHWEDVNLERGSVCIRRNMDWKTLKAVASTKSGKSRHVGLNEGLRQELALMGSNSDNEGLVFPNDAGKPRCLQNLYKRTFLKCVHFAGVRVIRIHDMRHTFAAHYVMNGGSIYDLKQILGHSDIKMTERYAHLAPDYLVNRTALVSF